MQYDIGDDEVLVGDEIESLLSGYEIGATKRALARPRASSPMQAALAQRAASRGVMVRESDPTKGRHYVLGFDSVANIAAGAALNIVAQPQVIFRPERIVVPASIAPGFLINDFRVGKNSQFASAGAIPAETFSQTAFGVSLKCDTAQVSQLLTIGVQNITGGALRFYCSVVGDAVE